MATPLAMLDMAVTAILRRVSKSSDIDAKCKKAVLAIISSLKEELEEKQADWFDQSIWPGTD